jgi:hypothetical protein
MEEAVLINNMRNEEAFVLNKKLTPLFCVTRHVVHKSLGLQIDHKKVNNINVKLTCSQST